MPGFCVFLLHGNRLGVASDPSAVGYRSSSVVTRLDHLGLSPLRARSLISGPPTRMVSAGWERLTLRPARLAASSPRRCVVIQPAQYFRVLKKSHRTAGSCQPMSYRPYLPA